MLRHRKVCIFPMIYFHLVSNWVGLQTLAEWLLASFCNASQVIISRNYVYLEENSKYCPKVIQSTKVRKNEEEPVKKTEKGYQWGLMRTQKVSSGKPRKEHISSEWIFRSDVPAGACRMKIEKGSFDFPGWSLLFTLTGDVSKENGPCRFLNTILH